MPNPAHAVSVGENGVDMEGLITVARQPGDGRLAEYEAGAVHDLHWDNMTGGVMAWTPFKQQMVFGYVFCDAMDSGELAHSCSHGPPPHWIKVCIMKQYNKDCWPLVLDIVGPRP